MKQWRFAPRYQLGTTDQLILTTNTVVNNLTNGVAKLCTTKYRHFRRRLDMLSSENYVYIIWQTNHNMFQSHIKIRDLRSFEIRFHFESNFRFGIRFVVMIRFEIFESSAPSIVLCKETIGGG